MEVRVGDKKYRIGKLNAFQQFEIVRRYSGVLLALSGLENPETKAPPTAQSFVKAMVVFARPISKEDCDYVNGLCLSKVQQEQLAGVGWQNIIDPVSGQLMFEDITMPNLLELVWYVMKENRLTDFFASTPATSAITPPQG